MNKHLSLIIGLFVLSVSLASAQQRMFLFPDFVDAQIRFVGQRNPETVNMNFDMMSQKILYTEGETLMEITNMNMIQTLVAGDRKFVMKDGLFCEILDKDDRQVLVNWKFKKVNVGSKGALGATTQAKVEVLRSYEFDTAYTITDWRKPTEQGIHSLEVWRQRNDNTYFLRMGGTEYKIKYLKDLYKTFPAQKKSLKAFAKENKLTMLNAEDAFRMFDYLDSLLKG